MNKKIDFILEGRPKSIGTETILQPLPHKDFRFASPFIVLHHLPAQYFKPGSPAERIPPHPHRGFAPVTFLFQGEGFHKDSRGNEGTIKAGGAQWMFAGNGLLHSEGPTEEFLKKGGMYEFVQLWVNVPAKHKWDEPYYKQAARENLPALFADKDIDLRLVSGMYNGIVAPIQSFTSVTTAFGTVGANKTFELTAEPGYWTLLYILEGNVSVNGKKVSDHQLIVFSKEEGTISVTTSSMVKMVFLSADPIDEPVAAKGNIVMNTAEEVEQAERDYKEGKFGYLDF